MRMLGSIVPSETSELEGIITTLSVPIGRESSLTVNIEILPFSEILSLIFPFTNPEVSLSMFTNVTLSGTMLSYSS